MKYGLHTPKAASGKYSGFSSRLFGEGDIGRIQRLGDLHHLHRSLAAEHDDAGGPGGIETEARQFARAIHRRWLMKARIEDHA